MLKTDKARLEREVEYWRNKLEDAEKDVKHKKSEMAKLEGALKKAVDAKKGRATNTADRDIAALQAKITEVTAERDRLRGQAEANAKLSEMMERNLDEANVKMDKMKKETICKDKSCESDKICGRSHILKKMKESQCKFYNIGMCQNSAEDCKYLHDAATKLKFHEEKQRERKSFAEIRKEERERLRKEDQGQDQKEEVEVKGKKKNDGLPAKKLSKVEKKKAKKQRQKLAKQEDQKNEKGKGKGQKNSKKKEESEDSESDMETDTDQTKDAPPPPPGPKTPAPATIPAPKVTMPQGQQDFQATGPAVQENVASPRSNLSLQNPSTTTTPSMSGTTGMTNQSGLMTPKTSINETMMTLPGFPSMSFMQPQFQPQHSFMSMQPLQTSTSLALNIQQGAAALAAAQAQQFTQFQHREKLRRELVQVQNQIQFHQIHDPGSVALMELDQMEQNLLTKMVEAGMIVKQQQ